MRALRQFDAFAAIDWSGQAVARPAGLAVALALSGDAAPQLVTPTGGWSRAAVVEWIADFAHQRASVLIGLDLSPAFPFVDRGGLFSRLVALS